MSNQAPNEARVIPLRRATRPGTARPASDRPTALEPARRAPLEPARRTSLEPARPAAAPVPPGRPASPEPLWRDLIGDVLRRERLAQERTLKDVAEAARISMPYLSEVERGRKEASSEVLAAAARALGLGLGELLSLAQGELVRVTSRTAGRSTHRPTSSYDGMLLAA
ncbi:helix-turn-helix domain-containing protein [Streptomyces sp. NPDC059477]|uniref:helix-turn-helix domain-containing protein n=1 Tax=Streptomyces sp. NPDC059477 TaxID=3346847 RepID=UPI003693D77E